jgi:hypothetical protein
MSEASKSHFFIIIIIFIVSVWISCILFNFMGFKINNNVNF